MLYKFDQPDRNEDALVEVYKDFEYKVTCLCANESYIFVATEAPELIIFNLKGSQPEEVNKIALSQEFQAPSELIVVNNSHCICLQQKGRFSQLNTVSLEEADAF